MPQLPLKVKLHRCRGVIKHGQRIRAHVFHVCRAAFQLIHHVLDMRVIQAQKALCNVLPAVFAMRTMGAVPQQTSVISRMSSSSFALSTLYSERMS